MYVMRCFLFLILLPPRVLAAASVVLLARTRDRLLALWSVTIIRNLVFAVRKPKKTLRHFPSREIVRHSPQARRLAFCLPPYDTPRVAPRNNSEFHVDCTHAAGGVCEQTKMALQKNIYRLTKHATASI